MAVRFVSNSDFLTYTGTMPAIAATGYTVTLWAYLSVDRNDYSSLGRLHAAGIGGSGSLASIETDVDGTTLDVFGVGGSVSSGQTLTVGAWHRIALTIATDGTMHLYVAPATGLTSVVTASSTNTATGDFITIGGRDDNPTTEGFNGRIAYQRVWSAVLTQTEIETEWANPSPVRASGLFADWPLETAADLADHSGNGRNLAAGSTAATTEAGPPLGPYLIATASDSAPATGTATRAAQSFTRAATDSAAAADAATRAAQAFTRTASDGAAATDAAVGALHMARASSDAAPGTDSAARAAQLLTRSGLDNAPAVDVATRGAQTLARTAADTAPALDAAVGVMHRARAAVDAAAATDTASRGVMVMARSASDRAPVVDSARIPSVSAAPLSVGTPVIVGVFRAGQPVVSGVFRAGTPTRTEQL